MGRNETVQPKFGEVGDSPPFEIVAAGSTAAFMAFTNDVPESLPNPVIHPRQRRSSAVLEVPEPAPQDLIYTSNHVRHRPTVVPLGQRLQRLP